MYVLKNNTENNRIGISVSKKVGNSVIRHHITRLVRESYRLHEDMFDSGLDIVVIARVAGVGQVRRQAGTACSGVSRPGTQVKTGRGRGGDESREEIIRNGWSLRFGGF